MNYDGTCDRIWRKMVRKIFENMWNFFCLKSLFRTNISHHFLVKNKFPKVHTIFSGQLVAFWGNSRYFRSVYILFFGPCVILRKKSIPQKSILSLSWFLIFDEIWLKCLNCLQMLKNHSKMLNNVGNEDKILICCCVLARPCPRAWFFNATLFGCENLYLSEDLVSESLVKDWNSL